MLAVREVHTEGTLQPERCIVAIGTKEHNAGESVVLAGRDFYGAPALNAAGDQLVTTAWDHPNMPWDGSVVLVVRVGKVATHLVALGEPITVAGGESESVGQPAWTSDGAVRFASDRSGWWQPYDLVTERREERSERVARCAGSMRRPSSTDPTGSLGNAPWSSSTTVR